VEQLDRIEAQNKLIIGLLLNAAWRAEGEMVSRDRCEWLANEVLTGVDNAVGLEDEITKAIEGES